MDMTRTLVCRLQQKCQTNYSNSNNDEDNIIKAAKSIEQLLWKQSSSDIKTYSDVTTLNDRLRSLMTIMVGRRMCQSTKTKQRTQRLIEILGQHRYIKIQRLIQDIKLAKMKNVASLKCKGDVCGKTFHELLPQQVRKLYFETTLIQAFEKYNVERLQRVDWDILIDEAESNLFDFKQWEHGAS